MAWRRHVGIYPTMGTIRPPSQTGRTIYLNIKQLVSDITLSTLPVVNHFSLNETAIRLLILKKIITIQ